jgi:Polyketide cyclase / dehydrase and lipid transport
MAADTYVVERSATIEAPPARIYEQIADFHNWRSWSPWEDLDPDLQRSYSGADSGIGAIYGWSGNRRAGRGRMEITDAAEPSKVQIALTFEKPFKARNETVFAISPDESGSGSRVTWSITGEKTFMMKVMGLFTSMDRFLGPDFEKGLAGLKAATEKTA